MFLSVQQTLAYLVLVMSSIQSVQSFGMIRQRYSSPSSSSYHVEILHKHENGTFTQTHSTVLDISPGTPRLIQFPILDNKESYEYQFTRMDNATGKKVNTTSHRSFIINKKNEWIRETVINNGDLLTIETIYESAEIEDTNTYNPFRDVDPIKCGFVSLFAFIVLLTAVLICNNIRKQNDSFPRLAKYGSSSDDKKSKSKIYTIEHGINNGFVAGKEEFYERYTAAPQSAVVTNFIRETENENNYTIEKNGPMEASTCHLLSQPSTLV